MKLERRYVISLGVALLILFSTLFFIVNSKAKEFEQECSKAAKTQEMLSNYEEQQRISNAVYEWWLKQNSQHDNETEQLTPYEDVTKEPIQILKLAAEDYVAPTTIIKSDNKNNVTTEPTTREEIVVTTEPNTQEEEYVYSSEYDDSDVYRLAQLVCAEVGSDVPDWVMQYTASVVINRVNSDSFPSTIEGVISQPWQYETYRTGKINCTPPENVIENARIVIEEGSVLPYYVVGQSMEPWDGCEIYATYTYSYGDVEYFFWW